MLDWIARPPLRGSEEYAEVDDQTEIKLDDAATTPAPVFAARAFKHLIWGTPKPGASAPSTRRPRRSVSSSQLRPIHDNQQRFATITGECPSTPKSNFEKRPGILLTPGTGGTRRKTVSFERKAAVADLKAQPTSKRSERPRVQPGAFPSPMESIINVDAPKPAHELSQPINSSAKSATGTGGDKARDAEDVTVDLLAPRSISGRYWKGEYDSYSGKSELEMKKLLKKAHITKKFARDKDNEAVKLSEALYTEQSRIVALEKQVADYVLQLEIATSGGTDWQDKRSRSASSAKRDLHGQGSENPSQSVILQQQRRIVELESTLSKASTRIGELEQANENFKAKLTSLQSHEHEQGDKRGRSQSQANGRALGARLSVDAGRHSKERPGVLSHEPGSDIWADVGNEGQVVDQAGSYRAQGNSSLKPRDANVTREQGHLSITDDKGMSLERREAAMKRLEERRKRRETGTQTVR